MSKTTIRVSVVDQTMKLVEKPLVASGGVNETAVVFDFCEMWDGYTKTAVFYRDEAEPYHALLDEDDTCIIPWEVCAEPGDFYFTVFGNKDDIRRTTNTIRYRAYKGITSLGMMPSDPTPTVYEQILKRLDFNAPADEQVEKSVYAWLDEHPEATTTVEDGSITEEKLSEDLKESLVKAASTANNTALTMQVVGQLFEKPDERKYVGWSLGNVKYDAVDDTVNVLVNAANGHGMDDGDHDLFLFKMNPHTMDYTLEPIVKGGAVVNQTNDVAFTVGKAGAYTYGFCIDSNGDYLFMPNYCNGVTYLFRSKDHGKSWSVTVCTMSDDNLYSNSYSGLMQTSTGRLIMSNHGSYFWYSDDDGASWTKCATPTNHSAGHEACIVELAENELLAVMRKSWSHLSNYGYYIVEPAFICYSHDNGTSWTNGVDSKTITEMSCTGCAIAKIGDRLELYATSRYPHLDKNGVLYQHAASVEDAMNDNWSSGKVLTYANAKHGDDFGYPGCCVDGNGNVHLFWYDGDTDERGSVNYYYAQGFSGVSNIPVNADNMSVVSPVLPYSAKMVESMINAAVAKLNARINQIVINGGGTPEPGDDLDGTFYVTDGLYDFVDFLNTNQYSDGTYTGNNNKLKCVLEDVSKNTEKGVYKYEQIEAASGANLATDLLYENGVTLELEYYLESGTIYSAIKVFDIGDFTTGINGLITLWKYNKTDGTTGDNYGSTNAVGSILSSVGYAHCVLTITGEEAKLYHEGKLVMTKVFAEVPSFASLPSAGVPKWNFATSNSEIYTRFVRAYNRALTAEEVNNNFKYQKALRA